MKPANASIAPTQKMPQRTWMMRAAMNRALMARTSSLSRGPGCGSGVGVAIVFAGVGTFVIATALKAVMGLRVPDVEERDGLDLMAHGERGYHFDQT